MLAHAKTWTFTIDDYQKMAETGIFGEDDRVELIEGEIVQMSPIGSSHASLVARLAALFFRRLGERAVVWIQNPLRLHDLSEPEPDLCLLEPRDDFYREALPSPSDTLLVIEVSDASLPFDRETKMPLYARCGIPELWIVDLRARALLVHREPTEGGYRQIDRLQSGTIAPTAFPNLQLEVAELLG